MPKVRLLITFLSLFFSSLLFAQQQLKGVWVHDHYTYKMGGILRQMQSFTLTQDSLMLEVTTQKQPFITSKLTQPTIFRFGLEKIIFHKRKSAGHMVVHLPENLRASQKRPYGILKFRQENKRQHLRILFTLSNTYSTLAEAVAQPFKNEWKRSILLINKALYTKQNQLPLVSFVTQTVFQALQKEVRQQLHKAKYKKRLQKILLKKMTKRQLVADEYLKEEILREVLLKKGYNPFSGLKAVLEYQQGQMEKHTIKSLRSNLQNNQQRLKAMEEQQAGFGLGNTKQKERFKAQKLACQLNIQLITKRLEYINLQQQFRRFNTESPKFYLLQKQLKQLKHKIETIAQKQYQVPQVPMKFKPIKQD